MARLRSAGYDRTALVLLGAAAAGTLIAIYLTGVHYAGAPLYCSTTSLVDCGSVTTSRWSFVPLTTIPVSGAGIVWFAVSAALVVLTARRESATGALHGPLRLAHLAWSAAGMAFVAYLVYAELVLVNRVCEWCTAVHLLTFASLLVSLLRAQQIGGDATAD